jgi:hypothetical protein
MKTSELATDIIEVLRGYNAPVSRELVVNKFVRSGYKRSQVFDALKELENVANIGQWRDQEKQENFLRWYPWREGVDDITQAALDRGNDW